MVEQDKIALRAAMKARRDAIPAVDRITASRRLCDLQSGPLSGPPGFVSGYLPIRSEIDPGPLLEALRGRGWMLALPVMQPGHSLLFRRYSPGDDLDVKAWGIREPAAGAPIVIPTLMLVPLLAVDRRGNRLGYGAGHYDRTIAAIRAAGHPLTTIALAFDGQIIDAVPHLDYDAPLDAILTPSGYILCQGAA